jgi:hypothetical protein
MAVAWMVITLFAFAVLLAGALVVLLRALDRRTRARDRVVLAALEQLRGEMASLKEATRRASVKIGGDDVALDEEMHARLEAVGIHLDAGGGMEALYAALERGVAIAERGFATEANPAERPEPPSPKGEAKTPEGDPAARSHIDKDKEGSPRDEGQGGRVIPLRPRGKPPEGGDV